MARQTSDYTKAASAVVQNMDSIYSTARRNSINPGKIAMTIDDANTERYKAYISTAGDLARTKVKNDAELDRFKYSEKAAKDVENAQKPARMAGKLAALGKAGVGYMGYRKMKQEEQEIYDAQTKRLDEIEEAITNRQNRPEPKIETPELDELLKDYNLVRDADGKLTLENKPSSPNGSVGTDGEPGAVAPSDTGTTLETIKPNNQMDFSKLTDDDWNKLAYVVSGEADPGTKDEFGVAASVLNRVKSGQYPNTIAGVVHQPKQYEAVTLGTARNDPALVQRLRSPEGIQELNNALQILDGRTDFKGQALLHNRVADEDPMFSSGGNFFHYNYQ